MKRASVTLLLSCLACAACGSNAPVVLKGTIGPEGGSLKASNGLEFVVPAGALAAKTSLTLTQLDAKSFTDGTAVAGVLMEPSGLQFAQPATLTVPLPEAWPADATAVELEFKTTAAGAYETGRELQLSADRRKATFEVRHFSGKICAKNCHAGTREFLRARFRERGCCADETNRLVKAKFPTVPQGASCEYVDEQSIQAVLDTFFDDIGGWDEGQDVPSATLAQMVSAANEGRQVAIAFKQTAFGSREGTHHFYSRVAHTTVLEFKDGEWKIRNAVVAGNDVLKALGGTNLAWWPLADLNGFRKARQGVAVEVQACGKPGCLGPVGIDPGDPAYPYLPLDTRAIPWGAVRIYVESTGHACWVPPGTTVSPTACGMGGSPCAVGDACLWCIDSATATFSGLSRPENNGRSTMQGFFDLEWTDANNVKTGFLALDDATNMSSITCWLHDNATNKPNANQTLLDVSIPSARGGTFFRPGDGSGAATCNITARFSGNDIIGTVSMASTEHPSTVIGRFAGTWSTDAGCPKAP